VQLDDLNRCVLSQQFFKLEDDVNSDVWDVHGGLEYYCAGKGRGKPERAVPEIADGNHNNYRRCSTGQQDYWGF